jgi:hypothetical protein
VRSSARAACTATRYVSPRIPEVESGERGKALGRPRRGPRRPRRQNALTLIPGEFVGHQNSTTESLI